MMARKDVPVGILLVLATSALLIGTFLNGDAASRLSRSRTTTLEGSVEWVSVDENNDVSSVAISTESGEYLVADTPKGKELFSLVHRKVKVTGKVVEDASGQKVIHVSNYEFFFR